jgi:prephenate dehydratase
MPHAGEGHKSKKMRKIRLGVLGPKGSFGEIAAQDYVGSASGKYDVSYFESHEEIICAISQRRIDEGVCAIENMINGTVREVLDLICENSLKIRRELTIPVSLCIAACPGHAGIAKIYSHRAALAQVRGYLKREYPTAKAIMTESTSGAMEEVAKSRAGNAAAIGTAWAAEGFGLQVIGNGIEDFPGNETRFVAVAREESGYDAGCSYKTTVALCCGRDRPGLLYSMLEPFATAGINLTKIESRPTKKKLGAYIFYIDFIGHKKDKKVSLALAGVKKIADEVRELGSYAVGEVE